MDDRREKRIGDESCPDAFPVATVAVNLGLSDSVSKLLCLRVDDLGVLVNPV